MKKALQFFQYQVLVLSIGFLAVSCDKDKDNNPNPNGPGATNTEYNGVKYAIKNGFYQNGGAMDYYFDDEAAHKTHYNYTMVLTDGNPVIKDGKAESMNDGKILIVPTLLSPGTTGFKTGTFEFAKDWVTDMTVMDEAAYDAKYKNKYFVPLAMVFTDTDGDKNWEEENGVAVTEGTFKVSGTAPNYTTEYDLKLTGGKTLKGSFSGNFREITD
jgi:hypothetical protein